MVRTKVTHGQGERMEVYWELEGKEVKRIGGNYDEDVSISDGKMHKQEKKWSYVVKCLGKKEYYSKLSNA